MRCAVALLVLLSVLTPAFGPHGLKPVLVTAQDAPPPPPAADPSSPPPPPVDTDADGFPDIADNCPGTSNPDQSDTDADGAGDACDAPVPPPPPDTDGDTIPDPLDNCPSTPNPDQLDADTDGAGDACDAPPPPPDGDADGPPDPSDNCPSTTNPDQADADGDGLGDPCDTPPTAPPTPTAPSPETPPAPTATPTATPTPSPPPDPTPVVLGPDDPSLFGWPAAVGGTPLYVSPAAAHLAAPVVIARVNAGGPALTTVDGAVWSADVHFASGIAFQRHVRAPIAATDDDALYRSERRARADGATLRYAVPVPGPGAYLVRLHLAARPDAAKPGTSATVPGALTVNLEGGPPELTNWVVRATGATVEAIVHPLEVQVADGTLDFAIDAASGRAGVAGIEVLALPSAGDALAAFALGYLGAPYVWATQGPSTFDCSGFTDWVASNVLGAHIGYNQVEQIYHGTAVAPGDLRPGDLVFFSNTHPYLEGVSHVGLYVGGGQFVHASSAAGAVVTNDLTWGYYAAHYYAAVRLA